MNTLPPETGASTYVELESAAMAAISFDTAGSIVLLSIRKLSFCIELENKTNIFFSNSFQLFMYLLHTTVKLLRGYL